MRTCPDCHALVADSANFCDNCGYPIGQAASSGAPPAAAPGPIPPAPPLNQPPGVDVAPGTCSACGFVNLPGETFCQNCGVQLHPVASQPPPLPKQVSGPVPPVPSGQGAPRQAPPAPPAATGIRGHFVVYPTQQTIPLPQGETEITLGRADPIKGVYPHVDLTPYGGDSSGVSRRHARLVFQNGALYIEDLNSTNFTFLNRRKLVPGQRYPLENGDELRLGLLVLEYFA